MRPRMFSLPFNKMNYALFTSKKHYKKYCKKQGLEASGIPEGSDALAVWHPDEETDLTAILMFGLKGTPRDQIMGLLLHECVHVWQFFLERIGEDSAGREIEAYSLQEIFQNLLAEYDRQTT